MQNIDENVKTILYTLRSLGFYAEVSDSIAKGQAGSGYETTGSVILTNAEEQDIVSLFPVVNIGDDENELDNTCNDHDYVNDLIERIELNFYCWPTAVYLVENDSCVIRLEFFNHFSQGGWFVDVKVKQPVRYSSNKIICFYSHSKGKYKAFSNFYLSEMETEQGMKFDSVEHYFQIMKAQEFDPNGDAFHQMTRKRITCSEVKALGRKVLNFDNEKWRLLSRAHMRTALHMKFMQNEELKNLLLSTEDAVLAEAAPRDLLWGIGYSENNPKAQDPSAWRGRNVLGNMLMYLRDEINEYA